VASAGGKISRAPKEVQPGATLFVGNFNARQELFSGTHVPLPLGALLLAERRDRQKEQNGVFIGKSD
jgi:hypothetical protein